MWNVINEIVTKRQECAVVLTTHSMEEAEGLCQRIGIMVGGRLRCLGSAQHLKNRYAAGVHQLELTTLNSSQSEEHDTAEKLGGGDSSTTFSSGDELRSALAQSFPSYEERLSPTANGAVLLQQLQTRGSVTANDVAAWLHQEMRCSKVMEFLQSRFPGAVLKERQGSRLRVELPSQQSQLKLGDAFGILEEARSELAIKDYALGQVSCRGCPSFSLS
jgi:ATP-binding cassette subfamily A (ABC1) protein 3